jgi:2-keto-4-pentenoate hydratase/2-oxohepta-3-ene-1,7-dioic acid hydratase in catechol pathway
MRQDLSTDRPAIVAFEADGRRIGVVIGSTVHDVTDTLPDIGDAVALDSETLRAAAGRSTMNHPLAECRLLAPVDLRARIFCVALNYRAHAEESGGADPGRPVIFHKLDTSLIGPFDPIEHPAYTTWLDYEAEIGLVIGRTARGVSEADWRSVVGGWTVVNDVSCRDQQATKLGDQTIVDWFSAKTADRTTPVGPWVVPDDAIGDPRTLRVTLDRNGERLQDATPDLMIFPFSRLVSFLSERVTLRSGDLIATGTPGGVGKGRGIRLGHGDVIVTTVSGVGSIENRVGESAG